jgi:hypothetical protein
LRPGQSLMPRKTSCDRPKMAIRRSRPARANGFKDRCMMDPNDPQRDTTQGLPPRHASRLSRSARAQYAVYGQLCWFRCAVAVLDACALHGQPLCTELRESADTDEASSAQSSREPSAGAGERLAARADEAMRRRVPFVLGGTHAHCDTHTSLPLPACAIRTSFCGM